MKNKSWNDVLEAARAARGASDRYIAIASAWGNVGAAVQSDATGEVAVAPDHLATSFAKELRDIANQLSPQK